MGFIERLSESSLFMAVLTGLGVAVCVIGIIWLIMLAGENIAKSARRRRAAGYSNEIYDQPDDGLDEEMEDPEDDATGGFSAMGAVSDAAGQAELLKMAAALKRDEKSGTVEDELNDEELIAVISAAVAAYGEGGGGRLVVRKIRRLAGGSTPWSVAAKADQIESRKF